MRTIKFNLVINEILFKSVFFKHNAYLHLFFLLHRKYQYKIQKFKHSTQKCLFMNFYNSFSV